MFVELKLYFKFAPALAHGVIGNTPVFGTVIQGSSPCGPTKLTKKPLIFERFFAFRKTTRIRSLGLA